ncbi:PAS domain S-box-containing protein [Thalassolituus maritimus]|uniref:PAS domain S-box-containing protein n=1 Tax=Thalassolituus maritimus TaxID=484498 RepID=A0A1N7MC23_9GAMM|nr:PAS domain-containing protein [Thalassolituus maritimus]SIS83676.1 PAS domain S-box-containing protein [Thalassolituus maritimus]
MVTDLNDEQGPINLELLKKAVDASNDGIVIAEQEGDDNILIYVNKAFERLTGYIADEILYQDCRFLQTGDREQEGLKEVRAAIKEGRSTRVVLRNYHKDGTMFWNELSLSPIRNDQDQLTYYIGIQKDVTAQIEAEARARAAEEELAALKASKA